MLQGTVRQIKITPNFILHQNAKFSTRQYFRLHGTSNENNIIRVSKIQQLELAILIKANKANFWLLTDHRFCLYRALAEEQANEWGGQLQTKSYAHIKLMTKKILITVGTASSSHSTRVKVCSSTLTLKHHICIAQGRPDCSIKVNDCFIRVSDCSIKVSCSKMGPMIQSFYKKIKIHWKRATWVNLSKTAQHVQLKYKHGFNVDCTIFTWVDHTFWGK